VPLAGRYDLNRVPTTAERWLGILLSALISILCLGLFVLLLLVLNSSTTGHIGTLAGAAFFGLLGCAGLFFFYRAVFTKPGYSSSRARRIFAICVFLVWAITIVGAALRFVVHLGPAP
jgi:hypothetical protein